MRAVGTSAAVAICARPWHTRRSPLRQARPNPKFFRVVAGARGVGFVARSLLEVATMTRFWRESAFLGVFVLATACSGKSSDLFEDATGGDGSEETGGLSNAGDGSSGDDGAGGSGARNTGGTTSVSGGAPSTGGKASVGGALSGGALGVGGVGVPGGSSGAGATPAGGSSGAFGGTVGVGGANIGGKSSVGGSAPGGTAGAGGATSCVDPDGADYKKRSTAKGSNGSFEDACDDGDLIEYVCETAFIPCVPMASSGAADAPGAALPAGGRGIAPPPGCMGNTGRVIENRIACGGRCDAGTCFGWCPGSGDELTFEDVAGAEVVIDNDTKNAAYRCEVTASTGNADCAEPGLEGETGAVDSLVSCSATIISFVARLAADATCTYRCSLVD